LLINTHGVPNGIFLGYDFKTLNTTIEHLRGSKRSFVLDDSCFSSSRTEAWLKSSVSVVTSDRLRPDSNRDELNKLFNAFIGRKNRWSFPYSYDNVTQYTDEEGTPRDTVINNVPMRFYPTRMIQTKGDTLIYRRYEK